jgi:hypothetical protein
MDWTEAHLQGDLEAMQQVREEAIVRAALKRAAETTVLMPMQIPAHPRLSYDAALEATYQHIKTIASDPAEVAAIIKAAGEDQG